MPGQFLRENPQLFFEVMQKLRVDEVNPTLTHEFLKVLQNKRMLQRPLHSLKTSIQSLIIVRSRWGAKGLVDQTGHVTKPSISSYVTDQDCCYWVQGCCWITACLICFDFDLLFLCYTAFNEQFLSGKQVLIAELYSMKLNYIKATFIWPKSI